METAGVKSPWIIEHNPPILLTHIHRNLLHSYWARARLFIARAVEENRGEMDLDDVLSAIVEGKFILFGMFKPGEMIGAATVELLEYPRKKVGMIVHLAGNNLGEMLSVLPQFDEWAKEHRLDSMMLWGRRGWERILQEAGFEFAYTVLERRL